MTKIFIKKKGVELNKVSEDLKVDLRSKKIEQKKSSKKWIYLSIFLFAVIILLTVNSRFLFFDKRIGFTDLIPEKTVVFSVIDQDILYPQVSPFWQFLKDSNFYGQGAMSQLNKYLNNAQLDFISDVKPYFEKEMAFVLLESDSETEFPFAFILKKKISTAQISQSLDKIELELKKDYNFFSETYRQTDIITLESFSPLSLDYAYAQVGDYFIISNSQNCLKNIIDNVINN